MNQTTSGLFGRDCCRRSPRHNQIDLAAQELGYECRKALGAAIGRAIVDDEVLFLGISKLREASPERTDVGGFGRLAGGIQHADAPDLAGRLRACGESPRNRSAAEKRDERAPFHVWMAPAWQEKM